MRVGVYVGVTEGVRVLVGVAVPVKVGVAVWVGISDKATVNGSSERSQLRTII